MRAFFQLFLFLWLGSLAIIGAAGTPKCTPVALKSDGNNIILSGTQDPKKPVVYFFKNQSLQSVWIDHPDQRAKGVSAGWASYLRPNNWSAMVLNRKSFAISCSTIQPGRVDMLNCAKTLFVCAPENMTTVSPLSGNYWMVEDKNWQQFIISVEKRGGRFS